MTTLLRLQLQTLGEMHLRSAIVQGERIVAAFKEETDALDFNMRQWGAPQDYVIHALPLREEGK